MRERTKVDLGLGMRKEQDGRKWSEDTGRRRKEVDATLVEAPEPCFWVLVVITSGWPCT